MSTFENWDADEHQDSTTSNPRVAYFIDYGGDGVWVWGLMEPQTRRVLNLYDEDTDIHTLVNRAIREHGIHPRELWLSPCGAALATLAYEMRI